MASTRKQHFNVRSGEERNREKPHTESKSEVKKPSWVLAILVPASGIKRGD